MKFNLLFLSICFLPFLYSAAQEHDTLLIIDTILVSDIDTSGTDSIIIKTSLDKSVFKDSLLTISDTLFIAIKDSIEKVEKQDTLVIAGVGDIMPGTNFPAKYYLPPGDNCYPLMNRIKHELLWQDITFGNFEGVLAGNVGVAKKCKDTLACYAFRIPDKYVNCVLDAGFDLLSVANNHVGDFGNEGRRRTASILDTSNVKFAGFSTHPFVIFDTNNITYAFIAFSTSPGTNNFNDYDGVKKQLNHLDTIADIVIVSFHGGAEGKSHQHVLKEREVFYGQDRGDIYEFAHLAIDEGADIIFGHGPHVIRAVEVYKNRFIAYSLGNFSTYARFNISGPNGISPIINVYVNNEGEFLHANVVSTRQIDNGITIPDPANSAFKKIQDLTNLDFPNNNLIFKNNQIKLSN